MAKLGAFGTTLLGGPIAGAAHKMGLFDNPERKSFDNMSPEQQQQLNELLQMLSGEGQLGQGQDESLSFWRDILSGEPGAFEKFSDPYMREFNEKTIPMLAERFGGRYGANSGALSSSGFGQSLSSAGAGLQSQLAALKAALQQQAASSIMGQYGQLSGQAFGAQPYSYGYPAPSPFAQFAGSAAQNAPQMAAMFA